MANFIFHFHYLDNDGSSTGSMVHKLHFTGKEIVGLILKPIQHIISDVVFPLICHASKAESFGTVRSILSESWYVSRGTTLTDAEP